jgi:large subunit ribosomal protein L10e
MTLRPGRTTRKLDRPWTRISRSKPRKSYVVGVPASKIHQFENGTKGNYEMRLSLYSNNGVQIRSNALEAARIVATALLEKHLGTSFFFKVLLFPHQVIREKPIATGAGADRYSRGMAKPFGKPTGVAVRVMKGQRLIELRVNKTGLDIGKAALKRFSYKIPTTVKMEVSEIKQ